MNFNPRAEWETRAGQKTSAVAHAQFLRFTGKLVIRHHVLHADAAVLAGFSVRQGVLFKKLDQERALNVEHVRSLHGRQFGVLGNEGETPACRHGLMNFHRLVAAISGPWTS